MDIIFLMEFKISFPSLLGIIFCLSILFPFTHKMNKHEKENHFLRAEESGLENISDKKEACSSCLFP